MAQWLSQSRAEVQQLPDALLYPWERGFLGVVFGTRLPLEPFGYRAMAVPMRVEPALPAPASTPEAPPLLAVRSGSPREDAWPRRSPGWGTEPVDEDADRAPVVARWRRLL